MRESDPGKAVQPLWLLIGNSRWHWARGAPGQLSCWSEAPASAERLAQLTADRQLRGWAAVGPVPLQAWLRADLRLTLDQVPLTQLPPWLGMDRALVGWRAWRLSQAPVLVADAGTALSFTRVDADGAFAGGRIQAGRALQLRALASGTAQLPLLEPLMPSPGEPLAAWPRPTDAAIEQGVRQGLVASVSFAWQEVRASQPECRLWITGGDGAWLAEALRQSASPNLALDALALLS